MNRKNLIKLGIAGALLLGATSITSINHLRSNPKSVLEDRLDNRANEYYYIKDFLDKPFDEFNNIELPTSFKIILLSNIAEGLVKYSIDHPECNQEISKLIENTIKIANNPIVSPYSKPVEQINELEDNGLYLSYLNIIYGMDAILNRDSKNFEINKKISNHLANKSLTSKEKNIQADNTYSYKYPADQTATLYSLYLFDKNYNHSLSSLPIKEWIKYMKEKGSDKKTKLHVSELSGLDPSGSCPRGCALSWSVYYMAHFAPKEARELWEDYKTYYKKDLLGFGGFREWPKGYKGREDNDTGPILFGVGSAATAFGIRAANAMGDSLTYKQLRNSEQLVTKGINVIGNENQKRIVNSIFSKALKFNLGYVNYYNH